MKLKWLALKRPKAYLKLFLTAKNLINFIINFDNKIKYTFYMRQFITHTSVSQGPNNFDVYGGQILEILKIQEGDNLQFYLG